MIHGVFSKYLIEHANLVARVRKDPTLVEIDDAIAYLNTTKFEESTCVFYVTRRSWYNGCDDELLYLMSTNRKLIDLAKWVNKNIILQLNKDKYKTRDVKLRIAIDMLNKFEYNGTISKEICLRLYDNMVTNIIDVTTDILGKDLPF